MNKTLALIIGAAAGAVLGTTLQPGIQEILIVAILLGLLAAFLPGWFARKRRATSQG